jgi:hypothetical protein
MLRCKDVGGGKKNIICLDVEMWEGERKISYA